MDEGRIIPGLNWIDWKKMACLLGWNGVEWKKVTHRASDTGRIITDVEGRCLCAQPWAGSTGQGTATGKTKSNSLLAKQVPLFSTWNVRFSSRMRGDLLWWLLQGEWTTYYSLLTAYYYWVYSDSHRELECLTFGCSLVCSSPSLPPPPLYNGLVSETPGKGYGGAPAGR